MNNMKTKKRQGFLSKKSVQRANVKENSADVSTAANPMNPHKQAH